MPSAAGTTTSYLPGEFQGGLRAACKPVPEAYERRPRKMGARSLHPVVASKEDSPPRLTESSIQSDEEIVLALATGDHSAMTQLFSRYQGLVYSVALNIVGDFAEAEEVVQTVFFDIFRAANRYDNARGSARVWLLQFAYHRALHRRRHLEAQRFYLWENLDTAAQISPFHEKKTSLPELVLMVRQALGRLKPNQRAVVELTYYEGLTAEEISRRTKQTAHVVRHDLRRAFTAMRETVGDAGAGCAR
jgi:RNA polymerase sigma-70 factor (ECF subfamily)